MKNRIAICFTDLIKILDLGSAATSQIFTHPDRILDSHVFLYIATGSMEVWEEDTEYTINEGEYLFLKRGLHHWGERKTIANTSWFWIHFNSCLPDESSHQLNPSLHSIPNSLTSNEYNQHVWLPKQGIVKDTGALQNKLNSMINAQHSDDPYRAVTLSLEIQLLLLSICRKVESHSPTKSDLTVRRVLQYLNQKEGYELQSVDLERAIGLNYSYLCDAFKKKTGMTLHSYNSRLFINKAMTMMNSTNLNVSQISDQLGFKNPYYFNRVFWKVAGRSPSDYMSRNYRSKS